MSMFSPAERDVPITLPSSSASTSRAGTMRRSSSTSITTVTSPSDAISSWGFIGGLVDKVYSGLAQLIGGAHHPGVRLIPPLIHDEVGELPGDIDGRGFDRATHDLAAGPGIRDADRGGGRTGAELKAVVAGRQQRVRIANRSHRKLPHHDLIAVRVLRQDA